VKVAYQLFNNSISVAYLDEKPLADGKTHYGQDKYTDDDVWVVWSEEKKAWIEQAKKEST
jgi:hypothetical protein